MEELITLDAIGCFEDEDDYEEEGSEDEEEAVVSEQVSVLFNYTSSLVGCCIVRDLLLFPLTGYSSSV